MPRVFNRKIPEDAGDMRRVSLIVNAAHLDVRDIYLSHKPGTRNNLLLRYVFNKLGNLEDMLNGEIDRKVVNKILRKEYGRFPNFEEEMKK